MNPSLALPFSDEYFAVSMHISDLDIPTTCNVFLPDNSSDYECRSLVQPAPELGAPVWTAHNRRILLGIYRDQGRARQLPPALGITWTRAGTQLTCVTTNLFMPRFIPGDKVMLYNVNTTLPDQMTVTSSIIVGDEERFVVSVPDTGPASGTGAYESLKEVDFYEDYIVFRLLPSMRVLTIAEATSLLASFRAVPTTTLDVLLDPMTNTQVVVPSMPFYATRMDNGLANGSGIINRQQFDEDSRALQQNFDARGRTISSKYRYIKTQNDTVMLEPSLVPTPATRLNVFDYYGFPLNDPDRGPFNAEDLISYDPAEPNGLKRKLNGAGQTAYIGPLYDMFGLGVTAAIAVDRLQLRDPVLPLQVDQFNVPFKRPITRV